MKKGGHAGLNFSASPSSSFLPSMRLVVFLLFLCAPISAAELTLSFALRWQGTALSVPSKNLTNASGQTLRVTRFSALISGVTLHRADGSAVQLDGQYGFIDAENGRL